MSGFQDKIRKQVVDPAMRQAAAPRYGFVLSYNPIDNTASIALTSPGTDDLGEIFNNVPCPTSIGVQTVAPEAGRPCWVQWKDNNEAFPIITHFFNHAYTKIDYSKQTKAENNTPRFFLNM